MRPVRTRSPAGIALPRPSLSVLLLCVLLTCLWLAGGASRADAAGQVVVRLASWIALIAAILFGPRLALNTERSVVLLLVATVLLPLVQLIPLPPALWQALPGRDVFAQAAALSGQPQPWRPLAIVPGAAVNAAASLIVPVATLMLLVGLKPAERVWLPTAMLGLIVASALLGVLQASGGGFDNPLINETVGTVSGSLANRNHFALLAAIGCLIAPVWAFPAGHRPGWRGAVALALVLLFVLSILASGSRSGLVLGTVGVALGLTIVQRSIRRMLARYPRWVFPTAIAGVVVLVAIMVLFSIATDRAVSIQRLFAIDAEQDLRARTLPTVIAMTRAYLPFGIGLGGFDPLFRLHEPSSLLKPTFFNQAHNDFLEIVLDAGLPGALLLLAAVGWWAVASFRAWRGGADQTHARLGSATLLLVMIASVSDYPARTPIIMAVIVVAAMWLAWAEERRDRYALPPGEQHL